VGAFTAVSLGVSAPVSLAFVFTLVSVAVVSMAAVVVTAGITEAKMRILIDDQTGSAALWSLMFSANCEREPHKALLWRKCCSRCSRS